MSPDLLRIFVSSPGDVGEERVLTERVVQRLQGEFGQSVKLQPILWEHEPMRATQHPQEQIPLPSECDIVVCLLWSRLGTRLPDQISGEGKTGTEWEFEEAARSFQTKKVPDLLVYHKKKEVLENVRDRAKNEERSRQMEALDGFLDRWFMSADGTFKAVFKTFQELDQFEELLEKDLRKLIQDRLKLTPVGEKTWHHAPFRGLEVFDFEHAPIFFGRTRAIGAIREALVQQAAHGCAFVLVFGMSGVGKSSLVRAGALPTITQPGVIEGVGLWRWCVFRPSDATGDLCDGLASALMAAQALPELAAAGVDARALAKLLREAPDQAALPMSVGLKRAAETTAAAERLLKPPVTRLALVVDQMEELFSSDRVTEPQRIGFVQALSALARSGHVWIIGTMRSDFYPRCAEVPELAALKAGAGQFDLLPPTAPQLAQMIGDPARAAGLRFEEKPTGERLDHVLQETALRDPQALPLLEFTLAELYKLCSKEKQLTEAVVLTFAAYDQLGGMEGALARRAEEEFAKLPANVQAALPAVFRALVTVRQGEDEAIVAQPALREVFAAAADQDALVEAFIQARLFVSDRTSVGPKAMVRLAHEALLRCWPRLVQWLAVNREFLRVRARVSEEAKRWQSEKRLPELLLQSGKPLAEGEFLVSQHEHGLGPDVVQYVVLSRQNAARARRRRRMAMTALILSMMVGTVGSSYFAWESSQNANKANENSEAEKKARKKADENAEAEKKARKKADESADEEAKARERAEALALRVQFEHYYAKAEERPDLALVGMASLLPKAARLKDQSLADLLRSQVAALSGSSTRLNALCAHKYEVTAVALSADGKMALTGNHGDTARLWEPATGKQIGPPLQHGVEVFAVALSADGKIALTGTRGVSARLWDTATGKPIGPPLQHRHVVGAVALSADGTTALTGSEDKTARLWDTATGTPIGPPLHHKEGVWAVALSTDGKTALTGSRDKTARLWDTATGKPIGPPLQHQDGVRSVALSADGKTALTAGNQDNTARLWNATTGEPIGIPLLHQGEVYVVALSADGKTALTGCFDRTARTWDTATGKSISPPLQHQTAVFAVALSADGKTALTGSFDKTARLWDTATGNPISPPLQHQNSVMAVALSADGKTALTGSKDLTARFWEKPTGKPPLQHKGSVNAVALSADGKIALTGSEDNTARLWETATGKQIGTPLQHNAEVDTVALSADGKTALTGSNDNTARLWDTATGNPIGPPLQHKAEVRAVALSADGKTALTGSFDKTARLWETATGNPIGSPLEHEDLVVAVALSADGKTALTGSTDRKARLWDSATGKQIGSSLQHEHWVKAVALSADGKIALTCARDKTARLWDKATGKPIGPPLQHQDEIKAVALSADGKTALTGSKDNTARLWETVAGKPPLRHQHWVVAVALSADGKTALTGSFDKTARLWETATCKPIGTPLQHQHFLAAVALSADGKTALTGSVDKTARLWDVPQPIRGDPERIMLWTQVTTGFEVDELTAVNVLDAATWQERRQRLQELGGPPPK